MKVFRVILAGILFAIIAQIIHSLGAYLAMDYYQDPNLSAVWSKVMMPTAGPPPTSFMVYSAIFALIGGLLVALVYVWIKEGLKGKGAVSKGLFFGFILFLVCSIPGFLSLYLLINIPMMLNIIWMIESLIIYLIGGIAIAALVK